MKEKGYHTSTYVKWFVSYVLVLILPFLFGCGLYAYALDSVRTEAEAIQELSLSRTKSLVENTVMDAANISEALICDENVMLLRDLPAEAAAYSEAGLVKEITKTIRHYETASQLISAIYICMAEKEYVISRSAYYRYEWFREAAEDFVGLSFEEFLHLTEEENSDHFLLEGNGADSTAYYVHSSYRYRKEDKAPVVIVIRYNEKLFGSLLAAEDYLTCLYQPDGQFLLSDSPWPENAKEVLADVSAGTNADYYLRQETVGGRPVRIVNLMEKQLYLKQMNRMKDILFLYILLCLVIGGALAWYLARKNYSPVKELAALAERISNEQGNRDEFAQIKASMERLAKDYEEHKNMARQKERQAKEALLARFLQGKCFGSRELFSAYELLGSLFSEKQILLIAYETEPADTEEEGDTEGAPVTLESLELPYFVLKNITEELIGGRYESLTLECGGMAVCLFGAVGTDDREKAMADAKNIAARVCVYAGEYFHYSIVADISELHPAGRELPEAFEEITELVSFRDRVGSPLSVIAFPEFKQDRAGEDVEQYRKIRSVQSLIEQRSYEKAAFLLRQMGSGQEPEAELPKPGKEQGRVYPEELMKEAAAYIDGHFTDKNLTAGFLADQMGLGLSNLSQMFKRYRGCGLLDYINQLRIRKAKELLCQGKTVKETADLVGFYTTRPLTNLFNQLEGMSPMVWKNRIPAQEKEDKEENGA